MLKLLILAIALMTASWGFGEETPKDLKENKYATAVALFATAPAPAPGGILLVGSSIFRKWVDFANDLAPLPVSNRAFGGSKTNEQLLFFEKIVPTSQASLVVWYCGSNDINGHALPEMVLKNTTEWLRRTRDALPHARIILVSVIRAPQKRADGYLPRVDEVNKRLRQLAEESKVLVYVDVNPSLETATGDPVMECYVEDKLHLTPEGYRRMIAALRPVLEANWKKP